MKYRAVQIIVISLLILGVSIRLAASRNWPLWQDEAETTINSLQILDHGYPNGSFKKKPLFENRSFIESTDEKYAFIPTNYATSQLERNKGWLTYYYQAIFIKIFGFSTFIARLPFALLFLVSGWLLFRLGQKFFSNHVGLWSLVIYTVNYYSVVNERQARYFSVEVVLVLASVLATYNAITKKTARSYIISWACLSLLFYTHLTAFVSITLLFIVAHGLATRSWRGMVTKKILLVLSGVIVAASPWIVFVKLWEAPAAYSLLGPIIWFCGIIVVCAVFGIFRLFNPILQIKRRWQWSPLNYLLLVIAIVVIVKPLVTPLESIGARLFVELNPLLILVLVQLGSMFFKNIYVQEHRFEYLSVGIVGIAVFFILNDSLGMFHDNMYDSRWVTKTISYLEEHNVERSTPIFVTYQQFPFMIYSDYNVDLVWPIRKSYIDSYSGPMYFIVNRLNTNLRMFYKEPLPKNEELPLATRINSCDKTTIDGSTDIYSCPPL